MPPPLTESARVVIETRDWFRRAAADGAVPHLLPRYSSHSAALGSAAWCLYLQPRPGCDWVGGATADALRGADAAAMQVSATTDGSTEADAACMLALCDLRLRGPIAPHPRSSMLAGAGWARSLCEREPLRAAAALLRAGDDRRLLPALAGALPAGSDLAQARAFTRGRRRLAARLAPALLPPAPPVAAADVWE
jgi:hypothetical protein